MTHTFFEGAPEQVAQTRSTEVLATTAATTEIDKSSEEATTEVDFKGASSTKVVTTAATTVATVTSPWPFNGNMWRFSSMSQSHAENELSP